MVALLDAAWMQEQPWRELVESRPRERWRSHSGFQQHLYQLQDRWNHVWAGRYGLYTEWLTDGMVTEEMLDWWETWMDKQADRYLRIEANPGGLGVEQIAQLTHAAIQRLAGDPGDRFLDEVIGEVFGEVKAEVAAVPARPGAGESEALLASVVTDTVEEYLLARLDWGWPAGRAGAWALAEVVDRHQTLAMTAVARGEGDTAFAVQAEQGLEERTRVARMAWDDQVTQPWLRSDVGSLLAAQPPLHSIPTQRARSAGTAELHGWVEEALRPERPLELAVDGARTAVDRARHHRDEERLVLQGLRRQLNQTRPWRPGSWGRRAELKTRIAKRQQVVSGLGEQLRRAEEQVAARMADLKSRQVYHDWLVGRAVAAVQELQVREQGLLDDRVVDPPGHLLEALGPPPSDAAGRQAWPAQALRLERARAQGLVIDGAATRAASSVAPPTLAGSEKGPGDRQRVDRRADAARWPVDPAVRGDAASGEPPDDLRPAEPPFTM